MLVLKYTPIEIVGDFANNELLSKEEVNSCFQKSNVPSFFFFFRALILSYMKDVARWHCLRIWNTTYQPPEHDV